MTKFEPWTSGIGSDRSTNWAITTAQSYKSKVFLTDRYKKYTKHLGLGKPEVQGQDAKSLPRI